MRVLVSGATGFVGSALCAALRGRGDEVHALTRRARGPGTIAWDPTAPWRDRQPLEGFDAVVHLAGESIMGRWTAAKRARIRDSRVSGTSYLCHALAQTESPPATLVCASATGIYGDRGDETLTEASAPGRGFLAEVAVAWEEATAPAVEAGVRVANARLGIVLARHGGALKAMLPPFRLGLGGPLGDGAQFWSWIALDDVVSALLRMVDDAQLRGPVNVTAPDPQRNADFTRVLAGALGRPALFRVPAFAARLAMGRSADELVLASARVLPKRLQDAGFAFVHPTLESALRALL